MYDNRFIRLVVDPDLFEGNLSRRVRLSTILKLGVKRKGALTRPHVNETRPETNERLKGKINKKTFARHKNKYKRLSTRVTLERD